MKKSLLKCLHQLYFKIPPFSDLTQLKIISMLIALRKITRIICTSTHAYPLPFLNYNLPFTSAILSTQRSIASRNVLVKRLAFQFSARRVRVQEFLKLNQIEYRDGVTGVKLKYCPFCKKPHRDELTNLYVMNISKENGVFHCFRCSSKGSWAQFQQRVLGLEEDMFTFYQDAQQPQSGGSPFTQTEYHIYRTNIWSEKYKDVVEYLHSRGFNNQTIAAYNLGAGTEEFLNQMGEKVEIRCVYFPAYKPLSKQEKKKAVQEEFKGKDPSPTVQIVKCKARGASKENKKYMRQIPPGAQRGFFGYNLLNDNDKTVVITEGEFDAMAVYQQTGVPALSLPQGATNLPQTLLPYLEQFDKIILWMDNDEAGSLNAPKIAAKLGMARTYLISHSLNLKDANDFLLYMPQKIKQMLGQARPIPEGNLVRFNQLREAIFQRMNRADENNGAKVSWLPFFNKVVKGLRMGELSVISGPTGSGKTTFLSQITLDSCSKDISVLWGSFQIRNQILIVSMLKQFSGLALQKQMQRFNYYADKFSQLPLYFMNFYGSHSIQKILSTITYAIEKYAVHVIVIDTLQFLLSEQAVGYKKFELQDTLMAKLREISIKHNVHVMVVIHPKKTEDGEDIGIHSIYGTSKATQEADNIWLIQNRQSFKLFDVRKNRYDGQLGRIPLGFNRHSKRFFQLTKEQFQLLRTKEKTMADIVQEMELVRQAQQEQGQTYEDNFTAHDDIDDSELNRQKKNTFYKAAQRQ